MRPFPALLPVAVVVAALAAGCGGIGEMAAPAAAPSAPAATPAPAAAPAGPEGGIPGLSGDPADLTAPTQAAAGTGSPPTGLLTEDVVTGEGPAATQADTVNVRYTGTLWTDGSVFDSSWSRGDAPIEFPLDGVVPGFSQGIEGMAPGGRRVIVMPPDLAYGSAARPGLPANSTLVFVVDLVDIS